MSFSGPIAANIAAAQDAARSRYERIEAARAVIDAMQALIDTLNPPHVTQQEPNP